MRKIKFRGKRIDNGEWVKGNLYVYKDDAFILIGYPNPKHACGYVFKGNEIDILWPHKIDPKTVGQFTGKLDKHKKEIYEGDKTNNGIVVWIDDEHVSEFVGWHLQDRYKNKYGDVCEIHSFYAFTAEIKVFSNIHDKPELLK